MHSNPETPKTYKEAMNSPKKDKWIAAIKKEIGHFLHRNVWIMTPKNKTIAKGRRPVGTKHVFKIKHKGDGSL